MLVTYVYALLLKTISHRHKVECCKPLCSRLILYLANLYLAQAKSDLSWQEPTVLSEFVTIFCSSNNNTNTRTFQITLLLTYVITNSVLTLWGNWMDVKNIYQYYVYQFVTYITNFCSGEIIILEISCIRQINERYLLKSCVNNI